MLGWLSGSAKVSGFTEWCIAKHAFTLMQLVARWSIVAQS